MVFLSPALALVLIPLGLLPLLIHLLHKSFPRYFQFPSIQLIRGTMAKRSRLHRWRHWILLLLRTLFFALLLLAFLRPVLKRFGGDPTAKGERHVLIVFDHSLSMENKGDGPTSRERGMHEAKKLIDSLGSDDAVNIILMEATPSTCFVNFSKDHAEAKRFLDHLKPGLSHADVNLANALAVRLISKSASRPEIYFISDFQRKNWANANFSALPPSTKLLFVDVGPTRRDNHAILDARLTQTKVLEGESALLEVTIGNFAADGLNDHITVEIDRQFSLDQEVSIAPWSTGKVTLPLSIGKTGIHLCQVRLPPDGLEYDNHFRLTFNVQEKEEVLIVTDSPNDRKSGAYFLKMALNPFENETGPLLPRVIRSDEISPSRLAGVRKIFFSQLDRLSPDISATLANFLFQGGGVIYFLDGPADAENLAALEKVIGPNTMPMRLARRHTAANLATGTQQIVRGDFKSRYLKLFQGNMRQNLSTLEFFDFYQAGATSAGGVLLIFTDESPAMAAVHHGLGTLLLLNFSASELSSNLARQRIFPAWMQDLVKAVSVEEPQPMAHIIGETLHAEVWRKELREQDFMSPSGAPVTVKRELNGDLCAITFTPDQLGFYTLGSSTPLYAFSVNTNPIEADLRPIDKEILPKEFAGTHEAHFVGGAEDFEELTKGRPLFHWCILGALGFLLLENGFQYFLLRKVS